MPGDETADRDERIRELEARVEELEARLEAAADPDTVQWLTAQVNSIMNGDRPAGAGPEPEEMTTLERYAQMPLEEREEVLPASEMRATLLWDYWDQWARRGPYGDQFLSTAQEKPASLRHLLRERDPTVDVQRGQDLAWNQVYRAMRSCHQLTEGALEYDECHATPDNTDDGTCHALVLKQPGKLPTLHR